MIKYLDDTMLALLCLLAICLSCIFMQVEGVKEIALTISGGIVGFLSKSLIAKTSNNQEPVEEVKG